MSLPDEARLEQQPIAQVSARGGCVAAWDAAFDVFTAHDWTLVRERCPVELLDVDWSALSRCAMAEEREVLRRVCLRTLVLELNCARVLGKLTDETPEARFAGFLARFRDLSGWATLFEEYVVLGQAVDTVRNQFRAQLLELIERLAADRGDLAAGGLPAAGRLIALGASLSDPHRGGRGVWKLTFEAAEGEAHLMYKPKPLAPDAHFQQLLRRCNDAISRGELVGVPPFRIMWVLDRGDYGWVEHLAPGPCEDAAAADRFYRRQGATLALLHVLLATDIHDENLIALGEHPVVVDLETLLHPHLLRAGETPSARSAAESLLEQSVLRVGLLPWRAFRQNGNAGINVGALGDGEMQPVPFPVARWQDDGRDDMRLVETEMALPLADNLPRVGNRVVSFVPHIEAIASGFEAMARYLARERHTWLEPGGALDQFARDPVRYILRPTRTYARVLRATAHPDHLRAPGSVATVHGVLDQLTNVMAASPAVREAENADLAARDIPYFGGRPDSRDVWDSRRRCIPGLFPVSSLAVARERLFALDDAEVDRQLWYTRAALAAAAIRHGVEIDPVRTVYPGDAERPLAERAVSLAAEIGARLADRAVSGRDGVTWIGLIDCSADAFTVAPLGTELYDGVAGIALFLATLGQATGEDRFLVLAEQAARVVRAALVEPGGPTRVGGFIGVPSQLHALAHVGALVGDINIGIGSALEASLDRLATALVDCRDADVMYGAAGAILGLLAAYRVTGREALLSPLLAALDVIERTAVPQTEGVAWPSAARGRPLLGFSHGNAGIACALARLGELLDGAGHPAAERCVALASAARRYERSRFDARRRNWPDFRVSEPEGRSLVSWCHGAPGVVLSRLVGRSPVDDESAAELELGVATSLEIHRTGRQTLCHGEVGNLAIVMHVAERLGRDDWRRQVAAKLPGLLDSIAARPLVDSPFADAAPGLMTGLAGIGYGLIALARPASVPLVLGLEPPS
jgi:type 2 lantibiotic biosynthesis protein LanM